jgi:glycosyltransferase involved in cell wall biosynthesis
MSDPVLSIIIPWANRPELSRTLAHNDVQFADTGAEVIVVSCGGIPTQLAECLSVVRRASVRSLDIEASFNKALAINIGVHHARGEMLFLLDSDIELGSGCCAEGLARASATCAVTLDRVVESAGPARRTHPHLSSVVHTLELEMADGRTVLLETNRRRLADGSRSAPGLVFLPKQRFEEVGGMNSDLEGWGWEDLDLLVRLQLGAGMRIERSGTATHISHGDELRHVPAGSRGENESRNASRCLYNYGAGHYLGTYADDVATWV